MERRLAAILCADVHGYSRLMGDNEEATVQTLSAHRRIIDGLIQQHHGKFVNSASDSVLAEFASVVNAVECAVEIQTALVLDLVGTFVFAISGAAAGVQGGLDLFGVLVLSFAAGNAGGITRDVLIGAVPPGAISDWRYLGASVLAGLTTFYWYPLVDRLRSPVLVFDAAGLALFAVTGTQKALTYRLNPVMAALLGMLTGIGGGMMRDVLVMQVRQIDHQAAVANRLAGDAVAAAADRDQKIVLAPEANTRD
jgi:uncharacterized membrane protein YeiH